MNLHASRPRNHALHQPLPVLAVSSSRTSIRLPAAPLCSATMAEAAMLLDASRSLVYTTARAVDLGEDPARTRRYIQRQARFQTLKASQGIFDIGDV